MHIFSTLLTILPITDSIYPNKPQDCLLTLNKPEIPLSVLRGHSFFL